MSRARKTRARIGTARSIRTITKSMEMVASARYRKSHDQVTSARPYTDALTDLVGDLLHRGGRDESLDHPLMHERPDVQCDLMLILTSNRGLCGGYNSQVMKLGIDRRDQLIEAGYEIPLWISGKKGQQACRFRGIDIDRSFTEFEFMPDLSEIGMIGETLISEFLAGNIGGVEIAYMQFISADRQNPAIAQLLPMEHIEPPARAAPMMFRGEPAEYEFLPSAAEILDELLPATVRTRLHQCFLDASVSERVMRMKAMRGATENADSMIRELTVSYNRMRQSQITSEIADIMGGRGGAK